LSELDKISDYINQLPFDLKAEILGAILTEQRMDCDRLLGSFEGQLKRVWSKDIAGATVENLKTGEEMLCLHLNRDGIYDTLPEAMFHKTEGKENPSGEDMAKESQQLKKEERDIRLFFQPFENEILYLGIRLSSKENKLMNSITAEYITGIIPYFWSIDDDLPENLVTSLQKILPLVYRITGNYSLTASSLEFILKEKVNFLLADTPPAGDHSYDSGNAGVVGECLLGVDSIAGDQINGFIGRIIFTVGPILKQENVILVKNGKMNRFLNCFYGYFIPCEMDVETRYIFREEDNIFVLNDEQGAKISYLGLNSSIQ